MTSANFSDFLTPSPPCLHLELIYILKFMQPPLLRPLFHDPLPPCPHLELIYTIKFTQPPLLNPLLHDPLKCRRHLCMTPYVTGIIHVTHLNQSVCSRFSWGKFTVGDAVHKFAADSFCQLLMSRD